MARKIGDAFIAAHLETSHLAREATPRMQSVGSSIGGVFGKAFAGAFAAIAAIGGIQKIVDIFGDAMNEAREAARIGRITDAAIKSTGGVAKVTAADVGKLADSLSTLVGVDDDLIQGSENLLLTFTNIRNNAGKNNDIFNQATKSIVDMTAAMNDGVVTSDGLKSATIQVGKALNDPIKGITALSRVGVTFDETQKKQIKRFVETGRVMDAQKIILKELNKEFGGTAAAAADPVQKAQVAWANFKEALGTAVMPTVGKLADLFTTRILPALQNQILPAIGQVASAFQRDFGPAIRTVAHWLGEVALPYFIRMGTEVRTRIIPVIQDLGRRLREDGAKALALVKQKIEENRPQLQALYDAFKQIAKFILEKVVPVLGPLLSGSLRLTANVIGFTITQIGLLVRAFFLVKNAVVDTANYVRDRFNRIKSDILSVVSFFRELPGRVRSAVAGMGDALYQAGRDAVYGLWRGFQSLSGWLRDQIFRWAENAIPGPIRRLLDLGSPSRLTRRMGQDTAKGFELGFRDRLDSVRRSVRSVFGVGRGDLGAAAGLAGARGTGGATNDDVVALLRELIRAVRDVAPGVGDAIGSSMVMARRVARTAGTG